MAGKNFNKPKRTKTSIKGGWSEPISAQEYRENYAKVSKEKSDGGKKYKDFIYRELKLSCQGWVQEYKFHPHRKWKADWANPELKIIVEYEGLMSAKSRHTSIIGYSKDCEKYNAAAILGYRVLRYTAMNYQRVGEDIALILSS